MLNGDSFTFSYTINSNRLRIKTYTLIDTGANRYTFIDIDFIAITTQFLDIKV